MITYDRRSALIVGLGRIEGPDLVCVPASDELADALRDRAAGVLRDAIWLVHAGKAFLLHEVAGQ